MTRRLPRPVPFLLLTATWLALWGEVSVGNLVTGMLVAFVVIVAFPFDDEPEHLRIRPWPLVCFLASFARALVVSSAIVLWEILTPRNTIREGIVAVELVGRLDLLTALVANSVSLTPGTLAITVDGDAVPRMLYVHVLHLRDEDEIRRSVQQLEQRILRAFGPTPDGPGRRAPATGGAAR